MVVDLGQINNAIRRSIAAIAGAEAGESLPVNGDPDADAASATDSDADGFVPPEERVHQLLSDYEGITWQGHIVADTGWSAPKTSRVLSEMEQAGEIARYRIGREKVVCLPGSEPACIQDQERQPNPVRSDGPTAKV